MARSRGFFAILIYAAIFALMEIAALAMLRRSSSLQDIWINRASHWTMAILWGHQENIRNHFRLQEINDALAEENFRLRQELLNYRTEETAPEACNLEKISGFRYIPASIVKISRNSQHNYIILDKGREDGIVPLSGIITSDGVIGIIDAVGKRYSYGITLMNNNVSISARVKSSGLMGPIVWDGTRTDGAVLKDIPLHFDVNPGDTIVTSGISTIFPPDIPLGVAGESRLVNGSLHYASVRLFQDFASLKYVTIVENMDREEINGLDKDKNGEDI